jgi:hypothetical protein
LKPSEKFSHYVMAIQVIFTWDDAEGHPRCIRPTQLVGLL